MTIQKRSRLTGRLSGLESEILSTRGFFINMRSDQPSQYYALENCVECKDETYRIGAIYYYISRYEKKELSIFIYLSPGRIDSAEARTIA